MKRLSAHYCTLICVFGGLLTSGCGSGHGATNNISRGSIRVSIQWPADSKVIPPETRSIKLQAQVLEPDDGQITNEVVVDRPEGQSISNATLQDVPSVKVRVIATAHSELNAGGSLLAQGSVEVRVAENGTVPADIDLGGVNPNPNPNPNPGQPADFMKIGYEGTFVDSLGSSIHAFAHFERFNGGFVFGVVDQNNQRVGLFAVLSFTNSSFVHGDPGTGEVFGSGSVVLPTFPDKTVTLSFSAPPFRFNGIGRFP